MMWPRNVGRTTSKSHANDPDCTDVPLTAEVFIEMLECFRTALSLFDACNILFFSRHRASRLPLSSMSRSDVQGFAYIAREQLPSGNVRLRVVFPDSWENGKKVETLEATYTKWVLGVFRRELRASPRS